MDQADSRGAKFYSASLKKASLEEASLQNTDFTYADLDDADLTRADMLNANLDNADMYGVIFELKPEALPDIGACARALHLVLRTEKSLPSCRAGAISGVITKFDPFLLFVVNCP